jgi:hypothetical protein
MNNNRLYKSDGNNNSYDAWELDLVEILSEKLEIPFGDAQGILEANSFYVSQAWGKGLDPESAADFIDSKTSMARGGSLDDDDDDYEDYDEDYEDEDEDEEEREYKVMCEDSVTGEREEYHVYNVPNEQRARVVALRSCDFENPKIVSIELYSKGGEVDDSFWVYWKVEKNGETLYEKTHIASPRIPNAKEISKEEYEYNATNYKDGGAVGSFFNRAKDTAKSKAKEIKRNIALDVIDDTRKKVNTKRDVNTLRGASNLVDNRYANGGEVGESNEVLSFFNSIDYSMLPKAFSEYVKKEILTDEDLKFLSPKEPVFIELKSKIEQYSQKPDAAPATDSEEKKKVLKEIADLEGIKDLVSGDELIKINKELDDLNGLLPIL